MDCFICKKKYKQLGQHLVKAHKITPEDYYIRYFKKEYEGVCEVCGSPVKFQSLNYPYKKTCSFQCAMKHSDTVDKRQRTCLKKYGTLHQSQSKLVKEKKEQTYFKHFGTKNPQQNKEIKQKTKLTCLLKYGTDNPAKSELVKRKISEKLNSPHFLESYKQTSNKNYGVDFPIQSKQVKTKIYKTKKGNKTFNSSSKEKEVYSKLKEYFKDVKTQYTSNLYPFNCDFYIPEKDLYIECNFHWTHNDHVFDENNKEDLSLLQVWEEKANSSKYYKNAIEVWTKRDPLKLEIATKNKLNYLVFWTIGEFATWIENFKKGRIK